jgi:hypothetical protein
VHTLDEMTPDMVHYGSLPESIASTEVWKKLCLRL